jgi:signal transduction histidine kinase/CheY-like chemotaxis protein
MRNSDQEPSPSGFSDIAKPLSEDLRSHPVYLYNQIALRFGALSALLAGLAVLILYPAPHNITIGVTVSLISVLFYVARNFLIPRAKTLGQLDLIVSGYLLPVFFIQWCCILLTPNKETSTGSACMIVISGLLFSATSSLLVVSVIGAGAWLIVKHVSDGLVTPNEIVQLLIVAPSIAMVVRFSVERTLGALQETRDREKQKAIQLEEMLHQLQTETELRRESEARLLQAQKKASLGVMAAGVAHDFNNTLRAITGVSELISKTHAEEICRAVQQASEICRQMLAYTGKSTAEKSVLDICGLIRDMMPLIKAALPDRVTISFESSLDPALAYGNTTQLQQVLMNLVTNAADAISGKGDIQIRVDNQFVSGRISTAEYFWISSPTPGEYIALSVADTGHGMDSDVVEQIFDPYFTTKKSGHGLGLSSVQGIASSHNAALGVWSKPGAGTRFQILLPRKMSAKSGMDRTNSSSRTPRNAYLSNTILVVDDDDLVRTPLVKMLELLGWTVVEASSGEAAVALTQLRSDFATILVDYTMAGMNGRETLTAIRATGCKSPAILCSGYISSTEDGVYEDSFDGFLQKPFRRQELEKVLAQVTHSEGPRTN